MSDKMKWYIVHTYSGMENSAKNALIERVKRAELNDLFGEILVPTENVVETKNNKKRVVSRRLYSGYLFVQMVFNDETWHLVKNTPRITGFLGGSPNKPSPISEAEIENIKQTMQEGERAPKPRVEFQVGEAVRIKEGAFQDFEGTIDEVSYEKSKLRVMVSIFGRDTPVELAFSEVEKKI